MPENKRVFLPKPCDNFTESSIELLKNRIMKTFKSYKEQKCNEKGEQASNLTRQELRGLRKLKKRVKEKEILILKTDKSGKLMPINREFYEKMGREKCKEDQKLERDDVKRIERRLNDEARFWTKMLNSGVNHNQMERILESKSCSSENVAPKYFMFKDNKVEGGYRPVVSGCNSDTLALSNTLSEVVEAVCMAIDEPYEVISSEDLLSRVYKCNNQLEALRKSRDPDWDYRDEFILLGSDVQSLFPSLSPEGTGVAVRNEFSKSQIDWQNVDWRLVTLYLKLNEKYWTKNELKSVEKYLPKRKSVIGRPPSIWTLEVKNIGPKTS